VKLTNTILLEYSVVDCRSLYKRSEYSEYSVVDCRVLSMGALKKVIRGRVPSRNSAQPIPVLYITGEKQTASIMQIQILKSTSFVGF
jgi:aminoglycoside N3'-acetyltransferase